MRDISKGYALVLLAVFFFGTQSTIGKGLMNSGIHPVTLAAMRILLGALMFFIYILVTNPKSLKLEKEDYLYFLIFGLLTIAVTHFCLNYAIFYAGVATASILLYTAPAFVTVLSIFFFAEKPTWQRIIALFLTLLGCYFITRSSQELNFNKLGVMFGILAGFSYGLWSILTKKGLSKYSTPVINFYSLFIGGLILLIASFIVAGPQSYLISPAKWTGVILMAFFNTFIPNNFYVNGMKYMAASKASILANFELVIAVLLSYLIFKEPFTFFKVLGFISIGSGLLLIVREDYKKKDA
ncbi:EamA family transporter [Clostridia bacterium]|nr:EamA family transporter [Clostridia bacterium]